jgi:hypothetical protein
MAAVAAGIGQQAGMIADMGLGTIDEEGDGEQDGAPMPMSGADQRKIHFSDLPVLSQSSMSFGRKRIPGFASTANIGVGPPFQARRRSGAVAKEPLGKSGSVYSGIRFTSSMTVLPDFSIASLAKAEIPGHCSVVPFQKSKEKDARFIDMFIYLRSNWGHPTEICLGAIAVLNEKNVSVPLRTISVLPAVAEPGIEKLVVPSMIRPGSPAWIAPFNASRGICIKLTLNSFPEPHAIRFWNGANKDDTRAVKNFDVFFGSLFVCSGELAPTFGAVHSLSHGGPVILPEACAGLIDSLMPKAEERWSDIYGALPIACAQRVDLVVHETYSNDGEIGLNYIDFFDLQDNRIELPDSAAVESENVMPHCSMRGICSAVKKSEEIWSGTIISGRKPALKIFLGDKFKLGKIEIGNYYRIGGGTNFGLKKVTLKIDGVTVWSGTLPSGDRTPLIVTLVDTMPPRGMGQFDLSTRPGVENRVGQSK